MSVFFTSDLHLGHKLAANLRGFNSIQEHDEQILQNLEDALHKKDKLFILGDICFSTPQLETLFHRLPCKFVDIFLGNHDMLPSRRYLEAGATNLIGLTKYKKKYWLSHAPIHPQELMGCINIHGHVHDGGLTPNTQLEDGYINVCVDFWGFRPVPFEYIKTIVEDHELQQAMRRAVENEEI